MTLWQYNHVLCMQYYRSNIQCTNSLVLVIITSITVDVKPVIFDNIGVSGSILPDGVCKGIVLNMVVFI